MNPANDPDVNLQKTVTPYGTNKDTVTNWRPIRDLADMAEWLTIELNIKIFYLIVIEDSYILTVIED